MDQKAYDSSWLMQRALLRHCGREESDGLMMGCPYEPIVYCDLSSFRVQGQMWPPPFLDGKSDMHQAGQSWTCTSGLFQLSHSMARSPIWLLQRPILGVGWFPRTHGSLHHFIAASAWRMWWELSGNKSIGSSHERVVTAVFRRANPDYETCLVASAAGVHRLASRAVILVGWALAFSSVLQLPFPTHWLGYTSLAKPWLLGFDVDYRC